MSTKKSFLKETPNLRKVTQKEHHLRECINTILKGGVVQLNMKKVLEILTDDLHFNVRNITTRMKFVISECLCFYIQGWPGWKKYHQICTNERAKVAYIDKFKRYLIFKVNYILRNELIFNQEVVDKKSDSMVSREVQTDAISKRNKPDAPYNLVVSGQPNVLNNIVFIEMDGDIIVKQHTEKPWKPLTAAQFLNYPYVYVMIKLPDIELSRSNLHEFQRYITECGDSVCSPKVDYISYVRKSNHNTKAKVYSIDYIHAYCKQFLEIVQKLKGIYVVKITELEEVFRQFILDIEESNIFSSINEAGKTINTMATDTSVCFNIGRRTYIRNKKMVINNENQKEGNAINFCEILIPKMAYTLVKFNAEEDVTTEDTTFKSLNVINDQITNKSPELYKFVEAVNSCVTYHCILCPKIYAGERAYIEILDHYRFLHKSEQSVLCFTCRQQFAIPKLAGLRWNHECTEKPVSKSTSATSNDEPLTPPTTNSDIGITDILSSGKSTISFDDLLKKQGPAATEPISNVANVSTSVPVTNTLINTLPVVSTAIIPASGVFFAITRAPSAAPVQSTSTPNALRVRTPIPIAPKPALTVSNPILLPITFSTTESVAPIEPQPTTSADTIASVDIKTEIENFDETDSDFLSLSDSLINSAENSNTATSAITLLPPLAPLTNRAPIQLPTLMESESTAIPDTVPSLIPDVVPSVIPGAAPSVEQPMDVDSEAALLSSVLRGEEQL